MGLNKGTNTHINRKQLCRIIGIKFPQKIKIYTKDAKQNQFHLRSSKQDGDFSDTYFDKTQILHQISQSNIILKKPVIGNSKAKKHVASHF